MFKLSTTPCLGVSVLEARNAPPSDYSLKIQSFSSLSKAPLEKYVTEGFETGGYKWKLSLYPKGDKKRDGEDHISIFLELFDRSSLPAGWEVNAIVNFFIYNHIRDTYECVQGGVVRRFHAMRTEWGFPKFIPIETFNDSSNGYLMDDTCVFGVEVFIVKTSSKGDCLSMIKEPVTSSYTWRHSNFSRITVTALSESQPFFGGDYKWHLLLYPDGVHEGKGNSISLFLSLENSTLPPNTKLLVWFQLRARDQMNQKHHDFEVCSLFTQSSTNWGSRLFISKAKFEDKSMGFLVDDTCIFEVHLKVIGSLKSLL